MLDQVLRRQPVIQRVLTGPIGPVVDQFVSDMLARGHARECIAGYVREAELFGHWLDRRRCDLGSVSEALIHDYLEREGRHRPETTTSAALRRLLLTLRSSGIAPPAAARTRTAVDRLVDDFLEHAVRCRGISAKTCAQQGRHVRAFLGAQFPPPRVLNVRRIRPEQLIAHIVGIAGEGHTGTAKKVGAALRMFLRFLVERGECADHLVQAVPTVVHRSPLLPRQLSPQQVRQLLTSFDCSDATGLRDYAIALCMVRLGLRVGTVVRIQLDDLHWRTGTLHLAAGKSRRTSELPLPRDLGRAIARYVREGRPQTSGRQLFVTHLTPRGCALDAGAARSAIRRGFERADLRVPSKGTHVLRHTVATRMIERGVGLKEIADVLGHRSLATTGVYARANLPMLRAVAMPWPEVT